MNSPYRPSPSNEPPSFSSSLARLHALLEVHGMAVVLFSILFAAWAVHAATAVSGYPWVVPIVGVLAALGLLVDNHWRTKALVALNYALMCMLAAAFQIAGTLL